MTPRRKKVLVVCKGHPNIAGAQLYLKSISPILSENGCELHFALRKADGLRVFEEISEGASVLLWEYDWRHCSPYDSYRSAVRLFGQIRPDAVLFNSSQDEILWPILAARTSRISKRIMVVHWAQPADGLPLFRRRTHFRIPIPSRYSLKMRILRGIILRLLTRIIFVNRITRAAYIGLYGLRSDKCVTIHNGVQVNQFSYLAFGRQDTRVKLGVSSNECMVLATGNLTEVKGYGYLVSAVNQLKEKNIPVRCFIAGQGELEEKLKAQIKSLGIEKYVELLGYRDDIPSLLTAADILCMPSLNEALGYSLLEAMAAGVPVVASQVGGIPEVISHGKEGFLVPPGDVDQLATAIERLAIDSQLRGRFGSAGRGTVRSRFSIETMLSQTRDLFYKDGVL